MPSDLKGLWAIGFGGVMMANLPQVLLSYLYLAFNALYMQMFMAEEWCTYACERKSLRVTAPVGQQRSTYWLNMPFRYAVPMQVMALLFHWLTSQSIFLVRMGVLNYKSRMPDRTISTNGFSPVAIILATCLGILIAFIGIVIGRLRLSNAMPVAASCSAVISAACHPPAEDTEASVSAVQWGVVTHGQRGGNCPANMSATPDLPLVDSSASVLPLKQSGSIHSEPDKIEEPVGHCTFSSLPVDEPIAGHLYA
ncbi:hypothetical protein B5807_04021 [Epicoccum nigrum]|uniref:Uncharacterized protein n=1 Tax=Epicoccum nigrum TaxID=105696 RepID=A0A1Y2M5S0_EPING|nr:hypothetical protein B5807_04021 [Epicoccum nigrum]